MRYYLIAGERSGDLHGGALIKSIRSIDPQATFRYWGGDCMEKASGQKSVVHYQELAVMGLDFLSKIIQLYHYFLFCKKEIVAYQPDALILIDYSGFNLRIAKYAKKHEIRTYYYIAPKLWAWRPHRIYAIKRYVDNMFTIFPFEKEFFKQYNYTNVYFVGNPTVNHIRAHQINLHFLTKNKLNNKPIIALMPGSRLEEVRRLLPIMCAIIPFFSDYQFVIAATKELPPTIYEEGTKGHHIKIIYKQAYDLLAHAHGAIITSGTATLEAALYNVPQVVVYKTNRITYWLYKIYVTIPYIALVNILLRNLIIPELIQYNCTPQKLQQEVVQMVYNDTWRAQQQAAYKKIKKLLGAQDAAQTVANHIITDLRLS